MEFSESPSGWGPVPNWVQFLIDFGYAWPADQTRSRRIALVSMPCDSAGAGLVALGALIRGLENPTANDRNGHYEALKRYSLQYLQSCRNCEVRCAPKIKGCGYNSQATGNIRHKNGHRYTVSESRNGEIWFFGEKVNRKLIPELSLYWQIDGEPTPESFADDEALSDQPYKNTINGIKIIPDNLRTSYSGLCFAGRSAGKSVTREVCDLIWFRNNHIETGLSELLTIHGWSMERRVSRMTFFNSRTLTMDRRPYAPSLVVADGDQAFLRVLDRSEYQNSDVIGVFHRTIEREKLESIGNRFDDLGQWYGVDEEMVSRVEWVPKGIFVAILRRRD